ncbi:MAG: DMT family transporter [Chloroflexi bacterium]|nr:MAG: DMT family transporter [Chloroflexota bacterium]MBL1194090.1 DMT family transporter [Chloroflexota bacterium]NOH11384.1 DMT family transporter [Chloroflexota bacterium]
MQRTRGINAALLSALFLGLAPIFGKQAINAGMAGLGVVAFRTFFAAFLLFLIILIFQRRYLYIYPVGLIGCLLAGAINGIGSLFYYTALGRLDAGVGHMLYSFYPLFVAFWLFLDHERPSRLTLIRLIVALPAVFLLVQVGNGTIDLLGVGFMLVAAALYALHLPINQRVLYEIPAQTVTLYTLIAMTAIVVPAYFFSGASASPPATLNFLWPAIGLTVVTFLSRITLFLGIKNLGSIQTALLGLGELLITVFLAQLWLGEKLSAAQWLGAALLGVSIFLVAWEKPKPPSGGRSGWFSWLRPAVSLPIRGGLPYHKDEVLEQLAGEATAQEADFVASPSELNGD